MEKTHTLIQIYVVQRLKKRKHNNRPMKLTYNKIAWKLSYKHEMDITYKMVRNSIDKMVKTGIVEKWRAWEDYNYRVNYYRLKNTNDTQKTVGVINR